MRAIARSFTSVIPSQALILVRRRSFNRGIAIIAALLLFSGSALSVAQTITQIGLPVIFVHGFCDGPDGFLPAENDVKATLQKTYPALYKSSLDYVTFYDGTNVNFQTPTSEVPPGYPNPPLTRISPDSRFFLVALDQPGQTSYPFNPNVVAQIPIYMKGNELANIIWAIKSLTGAPRVILVGHSLGGLDSRAYIEGLASPTNSQSATDDYFNDVASLITLDTPHNGADIATWIDFVGGPLASCATQESINRSEMAPSGVDSTNKVGSIIPQLNYRLITNPTVSTIPKQLPSALTITSIVSYWTIPTLAVPLPGAYTDNVLSSATQDLASNLADQSQDSESSLVSPPPNAFTLKFGEYGTNNTCGVGSTDLHFLTCTGSASQTFALLEDAVTPFAVAYSGKMQINQATQTILPGSSLSFTVSTISGAPAIWSILEGGSGGSISSTTGQYRAPARIQGSTAIYHIVAIDPLYPTAYAEATANVTTQASSQPPTVTTLPETVVGSDGATLNGTVNPNGSAVTAWFEYGISSTLATFQSTTPVQSIPAGTANVSVSFPLTGQSANTTYYYRLAASNGATVVRGTPILNFTTLNTLPRPTLLTPANVSTGVSLTPQLSWTTVPNAASYRVMMSTSQSALPTDPNSSTCAVGCVLGSMGIITSGTTLTPSAGQLSPSTQYFWEVHGRGVTQAGDWSSPIWSFTTASAVSNDFSIQVSPAGQSVSQGSSAAYNVVTATTSGSSQSVAFGVGNTPSGLTASFSPTTATSGTQSTLTVTASSSAPPGTYTLLVTGTGTSTTHTLPMSVTVVQAASGPAVTLNPSIVRFNSQAIGSASSPQTVLLMNNGTGQLKVSGISLSPGSDYALTLPSPAPPNILNSLVPYNIQVAFEPTTTGTRSGEIIVYDNAPGSPHIVSLTGTGTSVPPTTGTINVNATLNGIALPSSYGYQYSLVGPSTYAGGNAYSFAVTPGSYSISFSSSPTYLTLSSVTPSAAQSVSAGGTISYTLNFTAPSDFNAPSFLTSGGGVTPQIVTAGATANYTVGIGVPSGSVSTPITLAVSGAPVNSSPVFNPEPASSAVSSALTVGTTSTTPIGVYTLSLSGTNSSGLIHECCTSTLGVTAPPSVPVQLVSKSSGGVQSNAASSVSYDSVSGDGRYVLFSTSATNLAPGNTFQFSELYVRDIQSLTTTPVSVSNSGVLADSGCLGGSISANGQFAVFSTGADNLYSGSNLNITNGVYVRDLVHGVTEREDLSQNGTPANGTSFGSAISADGRFVAFVSNASNLVSGVTGMQGYMRDRATGKIVLISTAVDGSPASSDSEPLAMSADGRYVAFVSNSTKLVSQNTNGLSEAFVRDAFTGTTYLASASGAGVPANSSVFTNANQVPLGLSADGRFVVFSSLATNLVPQPLDGSIVHVFLFDRQLLQNTLIDVDSVGKPLGGWSSFTAPAVSADGRFITFNGFGQALVRDVVENQTAVVSLASNGSAGNSTTNAVNSSTGGSEIVFASQATNLVANDTNGFVDAFVAQNPFVGSSSLKSLTLGLSSAAGGSTVPGILTLSSPAPAGGATVAVWSNNSAAQPPAAVLLPAGATSVPISITTLLVPSEAVMTIMASYNGGSSVALLTLEPAAQLSLNPASWDFGNQAIATTSPVESIVLTNSGTALLAIDSVQLLSAQAFNINSTTCGTSIAVGASCSISAVFKPTAPGSISDTLQVSYGTPATTQSVSLTGNGATPQASLSPGTLTLASPANTTDTITLTNGGNAPLSSIAVTISGTNAGDFSISNDGCSGVILPANSSCLITVSFSPKASGTRLATFSVADNAFGSPQTITLTGSVVQSTPAVIWSPSATSITYGTSLGAGVLNAAASLNGNSVAGIFSYTATISGAPLVVTPTTVLGAGVYTLTVSFTPTDTTDYTTATAATSFTVNRATPTITWSLPTTMTYGSPLGSAQLNATASVAGAFTYSPGAGTILSAGTNVLATTFTPSDSVDYNNASATFTITVNPATPTLSWSTPVPIANGTALSATQLNATSSVPGSFVYSPVAGTVLTAGSHTLSVTFTPTDAISYSTAVGSVSITVGGTMAPTITWSAPIAITYGTGLSAIQLNATASVPGTFVYSPTMGTILTAGNHNLSITFTPTDAITYTTVTATTSITVNRATPTITWNTPVATMYGTTLGASQLNATASVPGTFGYSPGTGTILTAGTHSLGATFTPTDSTDYTTAVDSVFIAVNPATPAITWPGPAPIAFGTALGTTQLNATSTVPGAFTYAPPAGTLLTAGSHSITAIFTPTDPTDYTSASASVSITVNGTTPTITWNNAAPITYGTPLTATQLNATASVPGSYAYSPTAGTILAAGTRALSVTFTPTDTVNYQSASASSSITINPALLTVSAASASRAYGVPNPAFTASVLGAVNGDAFTASGSSNATISSDPGNYSISPSASGAHISDYTVTSVNGTLTITQAGSRVTVSSSNVSVNLSTPVTFTASAASATTGLPTGTINFFDGPALLGSIPLNSQGTASYTSSTLAAGSHGITAVYMGNIDFAASTSSVLSQTVIAPDYSVVASPTSLTVQRGQTGATVFTVTPLGGFNQSIQLSCSGLPIHSACAFSPATITPNGAASVTSNLTITTDVNTSLLTTPGRRPSFELASYGRIAIGSCLLFWAFGRKRVNVPRARSFWMIAAGIGLLGTLMSVGGCGSGLPLFPVTPIGTSSVTITASTSGANGISHSATLMFTVSQ